jgi:hypothetical protein
LATVKLSASATGATFCTVTPALLSLLSGLLSVSVVVMVAVLVKGLADKPWLNTPLMVMMPPAPGARSDTSHT